MVKVTSPIYLLTSPTNCWRCGLEQRVVGLAASALEDIDPDHPESVEKYEELVLLSHISEMPELIQQHIRARHPAYEMHFSYTADSSYYANICECGANFGDHFLFSEPGEAFFPDSDEAASKITYLELPFQGEFEFDCSYSFGPCEAILEHGTRVDD